MCVFEPRTTQVRYCQRTDKNPQSTKPMRESLKKLLFIYIVSIDSYHWCALKRIIAKKSKDTNVAWGLRVQARCNSWPLLFFLRFKYLIQHSSLRSINIFWAPMSVLITSNENSNASTERLVEDLQFQALESDCPNILWGPLWFCFEFLSNLYSTIRNRGGPNTTFFLLLLLLFICTLFFSRGPPRGTGFSN